jgi:Protein  of unknown function (DUF3018)
MEPEAAPEASRSEASMQEARPSANRRKVQEHRQRLRAQGMRPIQIWVPDVHYPSSPPRRGGRVCWPMPAPRRPKSRPSSTRCTRGPMTNTASEAR